MIGMSGIALTLHQRERPKNRDPNRQHAKNDCGWPAPLTCVLHKPTPKLRENLTKDESQNTA